MKKLLIALLALALCFSVAMAEDAVIDFENGQTGVFQQSGSCSLAVVTGPDGDKALAVTGRSGNNWDCADLNAANAGISLGDQVTITAWVYVDSDEEGTFVIAKSAADYGWYGNATVPGKTWTQISATFTLEDDVNIRFQNYGENWNAVDFYIDDVTVSIGAAPAAPEAPAAEMTTTTFGFEGGVPAEFIQSGACVPAVSGTVAYSGASALWVNGRTGNNWDAVDLNADAMGIGLDVPAVITAWVYVDSDEEGTFVIAKAGGDYATLGSVTCPGRTWTQITAEFSLDQPVNIRFQNLSENWNGAEYYIDDVTVSVGTAPEAVESTEPPIDYTSDFSAGEDGWYARSGGGATVSVVDGALFITGRTATWNSPGRDFALVPGRTYNLSVLVRQDQVASTGFILSIAHTRDGEESYENLGTCTAQMGEWTLIQATYVAGRYDKYVLYVEGGAADTEFYIKEFICMEKIETFGQAGLPSLKELYADQFVFGTAVTGNEVLDEKRMAFYLTQFGIFTPGNEMKPDFLLDMAETRRMVRQTGDQTVVVVKFDSCIPLLDWAQANGVKVHGHTLVWRSQTPKAFFHEDYATHKPLVSREVMLARMENYIRQVLTFCWENYPGVVVSWDVVNEAASDSGRMLYDCLWVQVVGDDYVNRAFEYARRYAEPGTLLFYNDYNSEMTLKNLMIMDILRSLIADGTVDGYGFQSHYSTTSNLSKIRTAWINISALRLQDGSPILLRVSELDVGIEANDEINWERQAFFYSELFKLYGEYADQLIAVHTWGTVDDLSWRAANYPLLFDAKSQPKPAFWRLVELRTGE